MNVLGLMDGFSCGQIALRDLGIPIGKYYSSEVDKFVIKQTQFTFPNTIQLGDINNWKDWKISWKSIDLIIGGFPCQSFSFAGKQLNFNDERGKLFFVLVNIYFYVKKQNPNVKFLFENVIMKKEYEKVINETFGIFPVKINSNRVSAQNRNRNYWTNIKTKSVGLFGELHSDIPQPEDRGILLKDILQPEEEVDEKHYLKASTVESMNKNFRFSPHKDLNKKGYSVTTHPQRSNSNYINGFFTEKNKFEIIEKACCLDANYHKGLLSNQRRTGVCVAMLGRNPDNPNDRKTGSPTEQRLEPKTDGKTNCLTSVQKDNLILTQKPHGYNKGGEFKDKSPTLLSNSWEHNNHLSEGTRLRRLTVKECSRLQTIPEYYEWVISDSQAYKAIGNGQTIEVMKHILKYL